MHRMCGMPRAQERRSGVRLFKRAQQPYANSITAVPTDRRAAGTYPLRHATSMSL